MTPVNDTKGAGAIELSGPGKLQSTPSLSNVKASVTGASGTISKRSEYYSEVCANLSVII